MQVTSRPAMTQQPVQPRTHRRCSQHVSTNTAQLRNIAPPRALPEQQLQGSGSAMPLVSRSTRKQLLKAIKHSHRSLGCRTEAATATAALDTSVQDLQRLSIQLHQTSATEPCQVVNLAADPNQRSASLTPLVSTFATSTAHGVVSAPLADWEEVPLPMFEARTYEVPGRVLVCQGSKCRAKGALDVLRAVSATTAGSDAVQVLPCKCLGLCKQGPAMRVKVDGAPKCAAVTRVEPEQVPELLDAHFALPVQPVVVAAKAAACCTDCKDHA